MSLSLNQPTPRLNDLLLRGGDDLSPELKEQALDDILAEFGSAPAKKAPAQTAPKPKPGFSSAPSGPLTPEAEAETICGSRSPSTELLSPVTAAAPQSIPFPTASVQPDSAPKSNAAPAKSASPSLVIDGIDFSEFLNDAPTDYSDSSANAPVSSGHPAVAPDAAPEHPEAAESSRVVDPEAPAKASKKVKKEKNAKESAAEKPVVTDRDTALDDAAPRPEIRRRAKPGSIVLRILAFAAVLATVGFLYTQTIQDRQSSASFDSVRSAVLQTLDLADMQEADAQMVRRLYGFAPSEVDGCLLYYPSTNMGARELLIVKLSDLSQQKSVSDAIQARKQTQMKSFEGYGIEQYDLLSNSIVEVQGNYILFVVHENAAAAAQAFLKAL